MSHRSAVSDQFAVRVREAEEAVRMIVDSAWSLDMLVAQSRQAIVDSRRLMDQVDSLLSGRDTGRVLDG